MRKLLVSFADCFETKSSVSTDLASRYVSGLLSQTQRKNMERMDERLGADETLRENLDQATQQFISPTRPQPSKDSPDGRPEDFGSSGAFKTPKATAE